MKKIIVLSLLAVMLTGCVKQADYDDLVKKNDKLESKVEDLEEENDGLRKENKALQEKDGVSASETSQSNSFLFSKRYEDESSDNAIVVYVSLSDDNYRKLGITFFPTMADNIKTHEANCFMFLALAMPFCKTDYYSIEIIDNESYCSVSYDNNGETLPSITSYDRNKTFHNTDIDGEISDWITESNQSTTPESSYHIWLIDTIDQIEKDIKGIYP